MDRRAPRPSGPSAGGNDHIHLTVNLVREDCSIAAPGWDRRIMSTVCAEMERAFGLYVVPGRPGRGRPGYSRAQIERARRTGADLDLMRARLERLVRGAVAGSVSEAVFVRALVGAGAWVRPRYADAARTHVSGYAVALAPASGAKADAVWFGGGRLAADLTLPKLRRHGGLAHRGGSVTTPADALAEWARPHPAGLVPAGLMGRAEAARLRSTGASAAPRPGAESGKPSPAARTAAVRPTQPPTTEAGGKAGRHRQQPRHRRREHQPHPQGPALGSVSPDAK